MTIDSDCKLPVVDSVVKAQGGSVGTSSLSYGPTGSGIGQPDRDIPGLLLSGRVAKFKNLRKSQNHSL